MKKLFTLIALVACVLGAKAEWVEDYKIDYSTKTGFPFYVMGYVPEWIDGVMTDLGGNYTYVAVADATETGELVKTEAGAEYYRLPKTDGTWHQYFIADGIPTELDGAYTVKAMVKASEAVTINVNMGWGWGDGQSIGTNVAIGTEWAEVEWEYTGIGGTNCNLVAQPNTAAQIEWKWLTVSHNKKEQRPVEWLEMLVNGDAEKSWADLGLADVKYNDMENNYKVCAWSKEKGRNTDDTGAWNPFPADIENVDGSNVFVVHGQVADTEGDASAWDNQFWIQSPKVWKPGTQVKLHFRYKASQDGVTTNTQIHHQTPSDYMHWQAIGDITFSTQWQEYDQVVSWPSGGDDKGWSIAFNLNPNVKDAVNFYFDDLSWCEMKLDSGLFVASANTAAGVEYDFDNATPFTFDEDMQAWTATVGTVGKQDSWVNEVMISTVRGNDAAFKSSTLKPSGTFVGEDNWANYTEASLAKIKLNAAGVYKIYVDTENLQLNFLKLEGEEEKEPLVITANPTVMVVHGLERDWLSNGSEEQTGTGEAWDNQFFIKANRALSAGETTVLEFKYQSTVDAKTTTQCHGETPGAYMHYAAIGDVNFTTEEQTFTYTFTVPAEADGMWCIAFNMAEIKGACDYTLKDFIWKLDDNSESLIDMTGDANFYVKEGAGTEPHTGINTVKANTAKTAVIYNLAGQRVTKAYKGIVVRDGKKMVKK